MKGIAQDLDANASKSQRKKGKKGKRRERRKENGGRRNVVKK
jgi:hypothetical protein